MVSFVTIWKLKQFWKEINKADDSQFHKIESAADSKHSGIPAKSYRYL